MGPVELPTEADRFFNRQLSWVVTTGTAGAGKGTLLEKVANTGHVVIPEAARQLLARRAQEGSPRYAGLDSAIAGVQAQWQQDVSEAILRNPSVLPQMFTNIAGVGILENFTNRCASAAKNTDLPKLDRETARLLALHLQRMAPLEGDLGAAPTPDSVAEAVVNGLSLSPALCQRLGLVWETTGAALYQALAEQAQAVGEARYEAFTELSPEAQKTVFSDRAFLDPVAFVHDRSVVAAADVSLREDRKRASEAVLAQEPGLARYTRVIMDARARFHNIKVLFVEPHAVSEEGIKALQAVRGYANRGWLKRVREQERNLREAYGAFNPEGIAGVDSEGDPVSPDKRAHQALGVAQALAKPSFMRPTASSEARRRQESK